ncbi:MAG TPA: hypothetical protein DIT01_03460, partial [Lentisphaeria bacterium]|nr:hypothetical protein [Lentisphaeria bacterium]
MKMLRKLQIGCISLLFAGGVAAFLQSQWLPDGSEPGLVWDSEGGFAGPEYFDNDKLVFRLITAGTFAIPDEDSNYAVINAFQTWEDVENAEIAFSRGTNVTVDTPVASANEDFTIGFTDGAGNTQWGGNLGGATGLATTSFFLTTPKQISDADIAFRTSANFSNDGSTDIDLEATALHEVGHALGLAHSPHAQSEMSYVGSWIGTCQCNTGGRTLTEDDKLAISLIYPVEGYLATVGTISGTITKTSDSSNVHMAQIGLFDSNDVLITTSLSDSGTYKIEGVPPGTYTLRAFPTLNSAENDNLHQSWESLSSLFLANGAPTDFITTASDDAAGVVVSANTTTSENLTVADGNSSMTCRFSTFKNGLTTLARTQGIRLKRGQAETVGLIGANMPSVGTLDELSILGGGLVISDFKDEASGAPNFTGETIVWDLSVDGAANFGSRALVLRNSAHPSERYLIFGYLQVYDEGSATAVAGTENPVDSGLGVGQSNVIMNQFTITAGAEEDSRVREWEITNVGTGSSGNVTAVTLNYDDDGNGQVDPGDTEIGTDTFAGPITFRSAYTIPAGATHNFLISYSFNGSESNDDNFLAQLSGLVVSGMDSSKTLAETGLPVNGGTMTIDAVSPTVDSVSADKTNGAYGPGEVIPIEVVFSEDVIVTGTPQITLETGGTDAVVDFTGASSGSTLTFDYTVGTGDVNTDLDYISTSALAFNSGTIRDSAGNTAVLTLAVPGAAGSLAAAKNLDIGLPVVDFTAAGQSTDETTVSVTVTATLDRTTSQSVSVPFSIAGGSTAADPDDYTVATGSPLTIAAGNTSATITINPDDDDLDEAAETVIVDMGTPVNASQGTIVTHTLTIDDDDATPTVTFTAPSQSAIESVGGLTITAQLSAVSGRNVSVPFTVNVAATATVTNDYTITASPINIAAGQSSQDITVTVVDDGDAESNETVIVDMGAPTNADQGATTTHTVTITDNDSVGFTVTESSGSTVVAENSGTDTFDVVLDVEPDSDVVLTVTSLAEAEATVDKATLTFTIGNWDTGQTVTVT